MGHSIIAGKDKTYSIRSTEWHNLANFLQVPTLLKGHIADLLHPLITLVNLGDDGAPFDGTLPASTLQEIERALQHGDTQFAFHALRSALYPNRVELPDHKGVAADMRHCGGGIVPLAVHSGSYKELEKHSASEWGSAAETKREAVRIILDSDGRELHEIIQLGESKGLDAYLDGTGRSKPVYMSGLERTRQTGTGYVARPSAPVSDFDSLLNQPFAPKA